MTFFEDITTSNAISQLERILLDIEKRWKIHITIHDHKGLLCLPDGHHILPHRNVHQNICCRWKARQPDVHSRCLAHCKTGAIRLLTENPVPTQTICWRFLTEVIVPIHRGREHVATFFGGTFRLPAKTLRGESAADSANDGRNIRTSASTDGWFWIRKVPDILPDLSVWYPYSHNN